MLLIVWKEYDVLDIRLELFVMVIADLDFNREVVYVFTDKIQKNMKIIFLHNLFINANLK